MEKMKKEGFKSLWKKIKNLWGLNPSVKDFLEKNPEKTVLGMFWAGYWRLIVVLVPLTIALSYLVQFAEK